MIVTIEHVANRGCVHPAESTGFYGDQHAGRIGLTEQWDSALRGYIYKVRCSSCGVEGIVTDHDDNARIHGFGGRNPAMGGKFHFDWSKA